MAPVEAGHVAPLHTSGTHVGHSVQCAVAVAGVTCEVNGAVAVAVTVSLNFASPGTTVVLPGFRRSSADDG